MGFPDGIDISHPSRLDRLRVAFAAQVAKDVTEADGVLDLDEITLMMRVFPSALMTACGFVDERGELTAAFHEHQREAARILVIELGLALKLELITVFHAACFADGESMDAEVAVLKRAATQLGVTDHQLQRHLRLLRGEGTPVPPAR